MLNLEQELTMLLVLGGTPAGELECGRVDHPACIAERVGRTGYVSALRTVPPAMQGNSVLAAIHQARGKQGTHSSHPLTDCTSEKITRCSG